MTNFESHNGLGRVNPDATGAGSIASFLTSAKFESYRLPDIQGLCIRTLRPVPNSVLWGLTIDRDEGTAD